MRLGGAPGGGDPLAMGAGNDYAELCDLGPSRWSSRSGYQQVSPPVNSIYHHTGGSMAGVGVGGGGGSISGGGGPSGPGGSGVGGGGTTLSSSGGATIRSNSFEAEDVIGPYGTSSSRIGNSTSSLRGRSGTVPNSTRHNGKKRPISPEQVIRLFNTQSSSSSVPTSYHSNGTRDRGRRSPASSPPSTTHQIYRDRDRDRNIPNIQNLSTRTVHMSRDQQTDASHGFGICVKGGKDSGVGVYISRIEQDSLAERAGLRPGDTILEVNGTPFMAINHEEALKRCVQILKSSRQISMTVRAPPSAGTSMINSTAPLHGFGPPPSVVGSTSRLAAAVADPLGGAGLVGGPTGVGSVGAGGSSAYPPPPNRQTCSWMDRQGRPASPPYEYGGRRPERRDRVRRVELVIEPGQSLGLMIRGGVEYGLGIFITGVDKDSVADRAGLMVGDQILEVNNQSFMDVTHDEAVSQFKFHKRMSLLVRDVGKVPHSCTTVEPEPWDAYSPTGVRTRRKCPVSAMVEEKARSLLPRHHFANLSYYIAEYGARGMTIEAFVSVLLEMLDTPEKHTLVTEIRELIFPEDRTRYDELVYRRGRDVYGDPLDRHRRKDLLPHSHDLPDLDQVRSNDQSQFNFRFIRVFACPSRMVILRVLRSFSTRFRMLTEEYFSSSSIHGMQYLARSKRSPVEKVVWIVIFIGSILACTILSREIYRKWQQTPVIIAINERMTPIWEIPFPAITICPEVHNYTASEFRVECVYYAYPYKDCEVTKTLVGEMSCATFNVLSAGQMFHPEVLVNASNYQYLREITEVSSWNLAVGYNNSNHIPSYPVRTFRIGTLHGVSVVIQQRSIPEVNRHRPNTTAAFQIILHLPNEYPQSANAYYEIPANQDGELHITPHMTTTSEELEDYLPIKRQCYYHGERKLKYFQHYTAANCELESMDDYITQYCGCAMLAVPGRENITACSVGKEDSYCWLEEQEDLQYSMSFDRIHLYPKPEDDCLPACTAISYDADVTVFPTKRFQRMENSITTTNLWLGFRTPQFVAWKRRELFSETELIASIGGLVGLFIGASLLSAVELIYFFTIRLVMVLTTATTTTPTVTANDVSENDREEKLPEGIVVKLA